MNKAREPRNIRRGRGGEKKDMAFCVIIGIFSM